MRSVHFLDRLGIDEEALPAFIIFMFSYSEFDLRYAARRA